MLIRNKLRYKIREDLSTFHESVLKNVIIEVEHSIVCSLYRYSNSSEAEFNHYYKQLLDKLILEKKQNHSYRNGSKP